ncbi:caffeine-induced death protein 2-domain-containing protein [Jimgerdemannia flammicorona]|uniref:Caffeine-induced death protein 2-domain-containing protein n=1 Tax=Jimgerdemannia flammicorona TaxID=994334 RepID=A0A433DCT8_9FUNG|nr:caffeine-induced death protein 2-domain-containing protein [Jimgerdemannia flammicorona]
MASSSVKKAVADNTLNPSMCYNLSFFKELMKEYRRVDDNIMLRMNTTDTHSESACAAIFTELANAYHKREDAVNYCLKVIDQELDRKNKKLEEDPEDHNLKSNIYTEESKRRMISNELTVEDIVRERSLQVFRNKCRVFDIPADFEQFVNKRRY